MIFRFEVGQEIYLLNLILLCLTCYLSVHARRVAEGSELRIVWTSSSCWAFELELHYPVVILLDRDNFILFNDFRAERMDYSVLSLILRWIIEYEVAVFQGMFVLFCLIWGRPKLFEFRCQYAQGLFRVSAHGTEFFKKSKKKKNYRRLFFPLFWIDLAII